MRLLAALGLVSLVGCDFNAFGVVPGGSEPPIDSGVDPDRPDARVVDPPDAAVLVIDAGIVRTLGPTGVASVAGNLGGSGGSPFSDDCDDGRLVTGIDAEDNDFGLCQLRAICSRILLYPDGSVVATDVDQTAAFGSETDVFDIDPVECPSESVMVGFEGSSSATGQVHHLRLYCSQIQWDGQRFSLGPPVELAEDLGSPDPFDFDAGTCSTGRAGAGIQGRSGTIIDRFQLRCFELELTPTG